MASKTFKYGGTHPPDSKLSSGAAIATPPLPHTVSIPLSQHAGVPAIALVKKGDQVKTGQLIARAAGYISANIHSSVSGTVLRIEAIPDSSGYRREAVIIEVKGDEWEDSIDRKEDLITDINIQGEDVINKCQEAGIVGLGGAAFPTHVKLKLPEGKTCELLIINGVECEPYLTSDHRLMLEKGPEILTGIRLLMKALSVKKAIIGIEANKPDAIENLSRLCEGDNSISVQALSVKYPQGGEKQLIKALTGREIPSGGLPADVGAVVQNIATAFSVYEAVQKNKPLIERVVTITGKSLKTPSNLLARIGTPLSHLIDYAGGMPSDTAKIINGGPMMGKALGNAELPFIKAMSGVVLLPETEVPNRIDQPCIRCAKCISACALKLEPYLLMNLSRKELYERAESEHITDCCECGSCSFICPASRPLLEYIRYGKTKVQQIRRERKEEKTITK